MTIWLLYKNDDLEVHGIIIINNQPTDQVQRPVGWNTMKIGLSPSTCPGLYLI